MSNKTSNKDVVTNKDLEVLEERIFHYEITKKIGNVDKMIPQAVKENEAIKHLLVEREQKDKRIKELKEENEVIFNNYKEQKRQKEEQALNIAEAIEGDYIPKQKVKERNNEF